mmetsp:Transcript_14264/g.34402  ORF Transcript_14264/g.34402 Transcript_14264/m.34402 type:complete len:221 (-) Transcript_14264:2537-3199(-)
MESNQPDGGGGGGGGGRSSSSSSSSSPLPPERITAKVFSVDLTSRAEDERLLLCPTASSKCPSAPFKTLPFSAIEPAARSNLSFKLTPDIDVPSISIPPSSSSRTTVEIVVLRLLGESSAMRPSDGLDFLVFFIFRLLLPRDDRRFLPCASPTSTRSLLAPKDLEPPVAVLPGDDSRSSGSLSSTTSTTSLLFCFRRLFTRAKAAIGTTSNNRAPTTIPT